MQYEFAINGRPRRVVLQRSGDRFVVVLEGRELSVDVARIDERTLSLLIAAVGPVAAPGGGLPAVAADPAGQKGGGVEEAGAAGAGGRFRSFEVTVVPDAPSGGLSVRVGTASVSVVANGLRGRRRGGDAGHGAGTQRIAAPMPGKVVRVLASKGERVKARQPVVVIEAMKMENELRAATDAVVAEIFVREGQLVEAGVPLALLEPAAER